MKKFDHESGQFHVTDGVSIYYEIIPNPGKPVLLLLHGGAGNIEDFNPIVPELGESYHLIGLDSRAHGRSTYDQQVLHYEKLQRDVESLLQALQVPKVSIIGFSDGGIIGYRLAAEQRIHVEKLVTIGGTWSNEDIAATLPLLKGLDLERWRQIMPESFAVFERYHKPEAIESILEKIKAMWIDESPQGYPNDMVKQIKCPTLIIRGDDDHLFPRQSAAKLADLIENSKFLNLPFADHGVFQEQKGIFINVLRQFLI